MADVFFGSFQCSNASNRHLHPTGDGWKLGTYLRRVIKSPRWRMGFEFIAAKITSRRPRSAPGGTDSKTPLHFALCRSIISLLSVYNLHCLSFLSRPVSCDHQFIRWLGSYHVRRPSFMVLSAYSTHFLAFERHRLELWPVPVRLGPLYRLSPISCCGALLTQ